MSQPKNSVSRWTEEDCYWEHGLILVLARKSISHATGRLTWYLIDWNISTRTNNDTFLISYR